MNGGQKNRIAIVVPDLIHGGGVPTVAQFLYEAINETERYTATLISLASSRRDPNSVRLLAPSTWHYGIRATGENWEGLPFIQVGAFFTEMEFQRYQPRNVLTALLNQYDLIQVVSGFPAIANVTRAMDKPVCLFMATLAQLERKPLRQNAGLGRKIYEHIMLLIISKIEKQALRRVDHIFAETEYTKQAIQSLTNASKISIDTIGVDTHRFRPINEGKRTDDYILTVGRFADPRKNITMLFESYALLQKCTSDAPKLILAGKTAPPLSVWTRALELGIADHVVVKENVLFDELVALYQNAAFFVLSSDEEGLGIVLLEAMACATPVISTRCGGPNWVVSDEIGFLTPVGDADAMAERLVWMLRNPEFRRQMGQAGRQMVETRFSKKIIKQKYLSIYDGLLSMNHI